MARQHEIVQAIMAGDCVRVLDGKKFGTLLGELLKIIKAAEEAKVTLMRNVADTLFELNKVRAALDRKTPEGLLSRVKSLDGRYDAKIVCEKEPERKLFDVSVGYMDGTEGKI
jgi:hypothetical protein